jgi:hypothetical protein
MDRDKLSYGEMLAGASAIFLSYFMFFDWFGEAPSTEPAVNRFSGSHYTAWEALDYIPIFLLVTIGVALVVPTVRLMAPEYKPPLPVNAIVCVFGIVSALLILYRIVDPPNFSSEQTLFGTVTYEGTVQFPIFLSLLAAVGVALGGWMAVWEEGVPSRRRQTPSRRPSAAQIP